MIRTIIRIAKVISIIFTPFYLPVMGLLALFLFSYLSLLPLRYKAIVLGIVLLFTAVIPTLLIRIYRYCQGWNRIEIGHKERRMVPYIISILSYMVCIHAMKNINIPTFMLKIVFAAIIIQIICAIINLRWKISTHMAAIGGVSSALLTFAFILNFNPLLWFCLLMLFSGILGSSRIILRQHNLSQVVVGYLVGFICALIVMIFI